MAALLIGSCFSEQLADWCSRGNQLVIGSLQGHELLVRSLLNHEASGHDGDDVRVLDGGQAVGDDDAGPALSGFVQGFLDGLPQTQKQTREAELARLKITAISQSCVDYYH